MTLPFILSIGTDNPIRGTIARSKPVLVLGAAGGIGRGVVESLLAARHPVIAVDTDIEPLHALRDRLEAGLELTVLRGSCESETAGAALAGAVRLLRRPPVAVVVALAPQAERGRLLEAAVDQFGRALQRDLLPQLIAARHLLPLLAESGRHTTWLLLGHPAAEAPWAGYGQLSVSSAALRMLARVLREETRGGPVHVQQLAIDSPVRTECNREHACPEWPSAREVGIRIAGLLAAPSREPIVHMGRLRPA